MPAPAYLIRPRFIVSVLFLLFLLASAVSPRVHAAGCISLDALDSAYLQDFDSVSNMAGSTTNNLDIPGWYLSEAGGGARDNEQYAVDTGSSTTGDTYSYGSSGSTDRALGSLRSGTLISIVGACFTNNTGSTINSLDITYSGEEWRLGTINRTDQLNFEYSTSATDLAAGTWTSVSNLNFITPYTTTTGAKDGNTAGYRTLLYATASSLSISNGDTFWIRWTDTDASGSDDGLAVDDFSITPHSIVTPTLNVSDVTLAEGNPSATTTFSFSVTLTNPAGADGVAFDIATADGIDDPALADNDYIAQSFTAQGIPAGSTGPYEFSVTVNGDADEEANETFVVNITNILGADPGDTQGLGTILNDDSAAINPPPTVMNVTSAAENNPYKAGAIIPITITFSEAVTVNGTPQLTLETGDRDEIINYTSGSGTDTLSFEYSIQPGDTSSDLDYTTTNALSLNGGSIWDAGDANAILTLPAPGSTGSLGANRDIVIDTNPPVVVSIVRANSSPSSASFIYFTITFSEPVTGVNASDFQPLSSGTISDPTLSAVHAANGARYTVGVYTGTGSGTLGLALTDNDNILDAVGHPLGGTGTGNGDFSTGEIYSIDKTVPAVVSISRVSPSPRKSDFVNFRVTFSETVTGVNASDFQLTTTDSISGASVAYISGSGATRIITVNTGSSGAGSIGLNLVDDDTIKDTSRQSLGGTGPGNGNFSGETYAIDRIPPAVLSILRVDADHTSAAVVSFIVTFSEPVTGVTASDFNLDTSDITGASIVRLTGTGATRTIKVNTGTGSGSLGLSLVDDDTIKDIVNNPLGGTGLSNGNLAGEVYTVR